MKQNIPLIDYNLELLVSKFKADPDKLAIEHWIKYVMSQPHEMQKVFDNSSAKDIQIKIKRRARRLLKQYIRKLLGLPKTSGSVQRQRQYNQRLAKTGLRLHASIKLREN